MKTGKRRTFNICLSDIDKTRILVHENGKKYLNLQSWDYDGPDKYDNDFSVSHALTKDEIEAKKRGEEVKYKFLGNGRIWEPVEKTRPVTPEELEDDDDLAF